MTNSRPPRRPRGRSGSSKSASRPTPEELHPVEDAPDIKSFTEFALSDDIQDVIAGMGITEPTPIQKLAITPVLEGRDVIAKAETGTGKTLAFGAPMMSRIEADRASVLGLVLCPTRELASQVYEVLVELGKPRGVSVALVVGGDPMHPQVEALRAGAQVVVGTPGRVLDLANQRFLTFPWTEFAVLDEADEMLEIGFIDDVRKILDMCSEDRQTLLFSATFPPELLRLARDHTKNPVEVATAKGVASVENITHYVTHVSEQSRDVTLKNLIRATADTDVLLVFCDRRVEVERVLRALERTRLNVKALHGGYDQAARTRVMAAFRDGSVKVLVATDVASRGLDIKHVTHVINLSVPRSISAYTHRSGRTGRAGATGAALTVVTPADERRWRDLEKQMTWAVVDFDKAQADREEKPARRERSRGRDAEPAPERSGDSERPRRRRRSAEGSESSEPRARRDSGRTQRTGSSTEEASASTTEERPKRDTGRTRRTRRPSEETAAAPERPKRDTGRTQRSRRSTPEPETREPREEAETSAASLYVRETRRTERDRRRQEQEERKRQSGGTEEPSQSEPESRPRRRRRSSGTREERPEQQAAPETERAEKPRESSDREERPRRRRSSRSSRGDSGKGAERQTEAASESEPKTERPRRERSPRRSERAKPPVQKEQPAPKKNDSPKDTDSSGGGGGGFGAGV